jgi:hypothetical protein
MNGCAGATASDASGRTVGLLVPGLITIASVTKVGAGLLASGGGASAARCSRAGPAATGCSW